MGCTLLLEPLPYSVAAGQYETKRVAHAMACLHNVTWRIKGTAASSFPAVVSRAVAPGGRSQQLPCLFHHHQPQESVLMTEIVQRRMRRQVCRQR